MAVYTPIQAPEAQELMHSLGLGELRQLQGITGGIENTNYFATTDKGDWVLTIFERLPRAQLPYFLGLMQHLARDGLPVPWPQPGVDGELVHTLNGKPAAVVTRLPGHSLEKPDAPACAALGSTLARLHRSALGFGQHHPHERGLDWWAKTLPEVLPHVPADIAQQLHSELAYQQAFAATPTHAGLPRGPIHADLFRDNALFVPMAAGLSLSGIYDFYFAGTESLLFDVAVCLNDWCLQAGSVQFDEQRAQAFLKAYDRERPLLELERAALPTLLRAAALRFWISRLWDAYLPRAATLLTPKDPGHFGRMLTQRIDNARLPAV